MTPGEVATLGLLDPEQGVCPAGHRCVPGPRLGERSCRGGEYVGMALICWSLTSADIDAAERLGADPTVVSWARSCLADRLVSRSR